MLKPGGRLMISDLISDRPVPDFVAASKDSLVGCLPVLTTEYEADLAAAGFAEIEIDPGRPYPADHILADPQVQAVIRAHPHREEEVRGFAGSIRGGMVRGVKPGSMEEEPVGGPVDVAV